MNVTPKISFQNVCFSYENAGESVCALENINLDIYVGELVCLIGHSGCGKSTMLNLLAGLAHPTSGQVLIDGEPVTGPAPDRSIVFQNYSLFPWQTAQKNVAFAYRQTHAGVSRDMAMKRALDLLDKVKMKDVATRYPHQLSGGMRQRVAIAKALSVDAPVMLLDEPFGALDPLIREQLQALLLELWDENRTNICSGESSTTQDSYAVAGSNSATHPNAQTRKTAVFVTHDIDEALRLADRIVFMKPRHIVQVFDMPARNARCERNVSTGSEKDDAHDMPARDRRDGRDIHEVHSERKTQQQIQEIKLEVMELFNANSTKDE